MVIFEQGDPAMARYNIHPPHIEEAGDQQESAVVYTIDTNKLYRTGKEGATDGLVATILPKTNASVHDSIEPCLQINPETFHVGDEKSRWSEASDKKTAAPLHSDPRSPRSSIDVLTVANPDLDHRSRDGIIATVMTLLRQAKEGFYYLVCASSDAPWLPGLSVLFLTPPEEGE